MSKLIADLLGADQRSFARTTQRLEMMCLQPGVDTKLTAEIIVNSREKSRRLNLDPEDTTKEELYYGLIAKSKNDDKALRLKLGITDSTAPEKASKIIAKNVEKLLSKDLVICMQPVAVKKILKAVPPKKTMRALKFRSIDSVLKREDPLVLYALASRIEDKSWSTQIMARMKRLQPRDAREHQVQVLSLPKSWIDKVDVTIFDNIIQTVPETGCVLILPSLPVTVTGSVLLTAALALQAGQKLAVESLPFRTKALNQGFETLLPEITNGQIQEIQSIHGLTPSWYSVFQLIAERGKDKTSEFEFLLSDLEWQSTETRLATMASELDFWVGTHFLGYVTDKLPISFHVVDVAASLVLEKKYNQQIVSHMKSSLWNEYQLRYLKQDNIERVVISQLTMTQEIVL
jgi:hypothetical protein